METKKETIKHINERIDYEIKSLNELRHIFNENESDGFFNKANLTIESTTDEFIFFDDNYFISFALDTRIISIVGRNRDNHYGSYYHLEQMKDSYKENLVMLELIERYLDNPTFKTLRELTIGRTYNSSLIKFIMNYNKYKTVDYKSLLNKCKTLISTQELKDAYHHNNLIDLSNFVVSLDEIENLVEKGWNLKYNRILSE